MRCTRFCTPLALVHSAPPESSVAQIVTIEPNLDPGHVETSKRARPGRQGSEQQWRQDLRQLLCRPVDSLVKY